MSKIEIPLEDLPKPCPRCQSTSHIVIGDTWGRQFGIKCSRCGYSGPRAGSRVAAIKAWNNAEKDRR